MNWKRVGAAALLTGICTLLAACSSGVVSDLDFQRGTQLKSDAPSEQGRIITVGDDFLDIGQNGFVYSVNDGTRTWVQQLAANYGVTIKAGADDGWGYAQGSARVDAPDPDNEAPSVKQQVDQLLADTKLRKNDVVFINGGMHDIVDAVERNGSAEAQQTADEVDAAAAVLSAQVLRLVKAGAGHVALTGVYDIGTAPWAADWGRAAPTDDGSVTDLTIVFNNRLLDDLVDQGGSVLYLDAAQFFRFVYDDEDRKYYAISNVDDLACGTTPIADCTQAEAVSNYDDYLFADDLHFTPRIARGFGHNDFGENAYQRFADRWGEP